MRLDIELTEAEAHELRAAAADKCADCAQMLQGGIATPARRLQGPLAAGLWEKLLRPLQQLPGVWDKCADCAHFEQGRSVGRCALIRDLVSCMAPPCEDFKRRGW